MLHPEPNAPAEAVNLIKPFRKSFWRRFWNALITQREQAALKDVVGEFKGDDEGDLEDQ